MTRTSHDAEVVGGDGASAASSADVGVADAALRDRSLVSILAVRHAHHLPRVKMAFAHAGAAAATVPANEGRGLPTMPFFVAREAAARWSYWLDPAGVPHDGDS